MSVGSQMNEREPVSFNRLVFFTRLVYVLMGLIIAASVWVTTLQITVEQNEETITELRDRAGTQTSAWNEVRERLSSIEAQVMYLRQDLRERRQDN